MECVFGIFANSVSLLADAGHNFSDVLGLVIAWIASVLVRRPPSSRYTYRPAQFVDPRRAVQRCVPACMRVNTMAWEAILQTASSQTVASGTVMIVATVGIVINGATAWLFASGRKGDLNIRGAFLHMIADAAVSAGVVMAGLAILYTGWVWLDPLTSLVIVGVMIVSGYVGSFAKLPCDVGQCGAEQDRSPSGSTIPRDLLGGFVRP